MMFASGKLSKYEETEFLSIDTNDSRTVTTTYKPPAETLTSSNEATTDCCIDAIVSIVTRGRGTIAHRWSAEQAGVQVVLFCAADGSANKHVLSSVVILRSSKQNLETGFYFNIGCCDLTVGIFLM
jgi:hypothetical protein